MTHSTILNTNHKSLRRQRECGIFILFSLTNDPFPYNQITTLSHLINTQYSLNKHSHPFVTKHNDNSSVRIYGFIDYTYLFSLTKVIRILRKSPRQNQTDCKPHTHTYHCSYIAKEIPWGNYMNINKHILCSESFVEGNCFAHTHICVHRDTIYQSKTDESSFSTYPLNSFYNRFSIKYIHYKGRRIRIHNDGA